MADSKNNQRPGCFRITFSGCCTTIILLALTIIAMNECKRSELRLYEERRKFQQKTAPLQPFDTVKQGTFYVYNNAVKDQSY